MIFALSDVPSEITSRRSQRCTENLLTDMKGENLAYASE